MNPRVALFALVVRDHHEAVAFRIDAHLPATLTDPDRVDSIAKPSAGRAPSFPETGSGWTGSGHLPEHGGVFTSQPSPQPQRVCAKLRVSWTPCESAV
jgi:hypothetical protein